MTREYLKYQAAGFKSENQYYIYDRFSNNIINVDEFIFEYLDDLEDNCDRFLNNNLIEKKNSAKKEILDLQHNHNTLKPFIIPKLPDIKGAYPFVEKRLFTVTLYLTSDCNFNCKYCYRHQKNYIPLYMSWDIAKKAIDFLLQNASSDNLYISFFGGEPMLNFDLIQKAVLYSSGIKKDITYSITSNGSLMTPDIVNFLVKYNINLTISLDGPEGINDAYRFYPNSKGTFKEVVKNLNYIKKNVPDYFYKLVSINAVLQSEEGFPVEKIQFLNSLTSLFTLSPLVEKNRYLNYSYSFIKGFLSNYEKAHIDNNNGRNTIPYYLINNKIHELFLQIHGRKNRSLDKLDSYLPVEPCNMGAYKIFVDPEGTIFSCDKLYYKNKGMIGNVDSGVNYTKCIDHLQNYYNISYSMCNKCWAFRFCRACYKDVDGIGKDYCKRFKSILLKVFSSYIKIISHSPFAFSTYK